MYNLELNQKINEESTDSWRVAFGSKAETLENLRLVLKHGEVLPLCRFTLTEYNVCRTTVLERIQALGWEKVIVRSSALNEDSRSQSHAGQYLSVLDVEAQNVEILENAIVRVFDSYNSRDSRHEVFVQPMLKSIAVAGVAFTCDIDTMAAYYVINYDETGRTDGITAGCVKEQRTYVHYKKSPFKPRDYFLSRLLSSLNELETVFDCTQLDVEFAFDSNGKLYVLQVRPIASAGKVDMVDQDLDEILCKIYKKIQKLNTQHPNLLGNKTLFGVMPDWNPAEIIGVKPQKLGLSLYKELITDNIWAYQRDNYGYRSLRSHPLMVSFLGVPFVDMRVDFNSFIPKKLSDSTASKLVNYYLNKLECCPSYHDKIEFEIVHSCYTFNSKEKLEALAMEGFTESEIKEIDKSLLCLTRDIIDPKNGLCKQDLDKIEVLKKKYHEVCNSDLHVIDQIYWLVEDCKRYGTLPFAGVARSAFVAVQLLQSMVDLNIFSEKDYNDFMSSLNTVSRQITNDLLKLNHSSNNLREFCDTYGHLRPGTYDITSDRYDQNLLKYFNLTPEENSAVPTSHSFVLSDEQSRVMQEQLDALGIELSTGQLMSFIRNAIEGREYAKFVFTRSLSEVLLLIEKLGASFGITREDLASLDFRIIKELYSELDHRDIGDVLRDNINLNKKYHAFTQAIRLPALITTPEDVYGFHIEEESPNFISMKSAEAEIVLEKDLAKGHPKGKIVFIKSADPGYDFLFSKGIAGLITQYGGANSHMAIRCAELGLPAVIGAGLNNFKRWSEFRVLKIDCAAQQVLGV